MINNENKEDKECYNGEVSMCSKEEMIERESNHQLSIFEIDMNSNLTNNNKQWKADSSKIIKAYYRINASSPNFPIRTVNTLYHTLNYIVNNIIDSDNKNINGKIITFSDIFLFVDDRFKAIRQDFTLLNIFQTKHQYEIKIYEYILKIMIRFYIISLNHGLNYPSIHGDQCLYNLILPQIKSMLITLIECYNISQQYYNSNDYEEFYSYFLLISLYLNPLDFYTTLSQLFQSPIDKTPKIKNTLKICQCVLGKNWKKFLKMLHTSPEIDYITSCLLIIFFPLIRIEAMNYICFGYTNEITHYKISLNTLQHILLFNSITSLNDFLTWYGIDKSIQNENNSLPISFYKYKLPPSNLHITTIPKETNNYIETKKTFQTRKEEIIKNINIKNHN